MFFAKQHLPHNEAHEVKIMDIKLALVFSLISVMIALDFLDEKTVARIKQQLQTRQWRRFKLRRDRI